MFFSDTGAVFAFGRSHLTISGDGNDNNYFFIKKDKIKRLICGRNQSAVICGNFGSEMDSLNTRINLIEQKTYFRFIIGFVMCRNNALAAFQSIHKQRASIVRKGKGKEKKSFSAFWLKAFE